MNICAYILFLSFQLNWLSPLRIIPEYSKVHKEKLQPIKDTPCGLIILSRRVSIEVA